LISGASVSRSSGLTSIGEPYEFGNLSVTIA
jgi:hypothetical protein